MPSPGEDYQSWSVTATSNGNADPLINWQEHQTRASVNNSSRSQMAAHAKNRNLLNGSIVTTGAANAQIFLSGVNYTTIPTGLIVKLKIGTGLTNTSSTTLNMDGIGAVLVKTANGDNLLGGEFVASGYVDLIYDGTNWLFLYGREFMFDRITSGGGIILATQTFASAGTFTYTPTPGMECCIIECIGGGGGGGNANAAAGHYMSGGGGGSGGYSRKTASAVDIGASKIVTVGAGGFGGTGSPLGTGTNGGASSLGSLCIANGGIGGSAAQIGLAIPIGGASSAACAGDSAAAGAPGSAGFYSEEPLHIYAGSGPGGSSVFGGAGVGIGTNSTAVAGRSYGSGGSGANSWNALGSRIAGNGSTGLVVVTEFAGKGAPGRDGLQGAPGPIGPPGPAGTGTGDVL